MSDYFKSMDRERFAYQPWYGQVQERLHGANSIIVAFVIVAFVSHGSSQTSESCLLFLSPGAAANVGRAELGLFTTIKPKAAGSFLYS